MKLLEIGTGDAEFFVEFAGCGVIVGFAGGDVSGAGGGPDRGEFFCGRAFVDEQLTIGPEEEDVYGTVEQFVLVDECS
jgi:hypothetical protein